MVQPQPFLLGAHFRDVGSHPHLRHLSGSSRELCGAALPSCWPRVPSLSTAPDSGTPLSIRGMSWAAQATSDCCLCLCLCPGAGKASIVPHPRAPAVCEASGEGRGPSPPQAAHPGSSSPCSHAASWALLCLLLGAVKVALAALSASAPGPCVVFWDGTEAAQLPEAGSECAGGELLVGLQKELLGLSTSLPAWEKGGQSWGAAVWSLLLRGNNSPGSWSSASWSRDPKPVPCAGVGTGAGLFPPQGGDFAILRSMK